METQFKGVIIKLRGVHDIDDIMAHINLGGISLIKDDREWMLDPAITYFFQKEHSYTTIEIELEPLEFAKKCFTDCKFDLNDEDLKNLDSGEIYLTWEDDCTYHYDSDIESITLKCELDGELFDVDLDSDTYKIKRELDKIDRLMHMRKDWQHADYVEAYGDLWEDMPSHVINCWEKMEEYVRNTYDETLIDELLIVEKV